MKRLEVAHSAASLGYAASGPAYSIPALAKGQARQGASVELHTIGGVPVHGSDGLLDIRHAADLTAWPGVSLLALSGSMRRTLARGRFDIVHTHGLWRMPNVYGSPGAKMVISPRGMLAPAALAFSARQKRIFLALFQRRALNAAAMFHATSEGEYEDIRRFGLAQPVAIVPNGVDLPERANVQPARSQRRLVLSLGRIHPVKGLPDLLRAWARTEPGHPDWDLRIVGPDERGHAAELADLAQRLDLKRVRIDPPLLGRERDVLMASADLFVLSSRSENFAMTVAESLASGVPVISTKGAPWPGLVPERCGWWIDHGPDALAQALGDAISLPEEERRAMGARGRSWMERDFSWDRMAVLSLEAYAWLAGHGDRPSQVRVD